MKNTKLRLASIFGILMFSLSSFIFLNINSDFNTSLKEENNLIVLSNESNVENENQSRASEWVLKTIINITESLILGDIDNHSNSSFLN